MRLHDAILETPDVRFEPGDSSIGQNGPDGGALNIWLVNAKGHVAISSPGLALLADVDSLLVPAFANTEHATRWGSQPGRYEHAALRQMQRDASDPAFGARNPQSTHHTMGAYR